MAGRKKKSTIFDVAKLAGVSIKTVSRVVNKEPNVQDKTRSRVEAAIEELGYRPNVSARGLSSKRSYVIGLIYENPEEFSYVKDVLNGALAECEANGYSLVLRPINSPGDRLIEDIRRFVTDTHMDGMILPPPLGDFDGLPALLKELDIPCARLSPRLELENTIAVHCNDEDASGELTQYLIDQGHRRIGFVKGIPDHSSTQGRLRGYLDTLERNGIDADDALIHQGFFNFESGKVAAHQLLNLKTPPTAIIASNDDMAVGVLYEAHEAGISIPGGLSIAGFDDTVIAQHIWPPLTTVRQPIVAMTRSAVRQLIGRIEQREDMAGGDEFTCEIVVRQSTAAPE